MNYRRIEVGDYVDISIDANNIETVRGVVGYIPAATGDCWHIIPNKSENITGDVVHYVQQFHVMTRWKNDLPAL